MSHCVLELGREYLPSELRLRLPGAIFPLNCKFRIQRVSPKVYRNRSRPPLRLILIIAPELRALANPRTLRRKRYAAVFATPQGARNNKRPNRLLHLMWAVMKRR